MSVCAYLCSYLFDIISFNIYFLSYICFFNTHVFAFTPQDKIEHFSEFHGCKNLNRFNISRPNKDCQHLFKSIIVPK